MQLTVREVATLLKVSERKVRAWIKGAGLPAYRVHETYRFNRAELLEWATSRNLEVPYAMSEYAPNTFTTGLYVGLIGDFSFYYIVDSNNMQMQVLDQLYAETNQTGYIARQESDGMPVLSEAFARVKLA